jgi:hypothetical protein
MRLPNQSAGVKRSIAGHAEGMGYLVRPSQISLRGPGRVQGIILNCPDDVCCDGQGHCRCCVAQVLTIHVD